MAQDAPSLADFIARGDKLDQGPEEGRLLERFIRRGEDVGFVEEASTTPLGQRKELLDWVPFAATGREGIGWVDMFGAAERINEGAGTADDRRMLEDYLDWHARRRTRGGRVGGIVGEAPVFMGEFATGNKAASLIGEKLLKTAGGQALQKALKRLAATRFAGFMEEHATTRVLRGLAKGGARGAAIGATLEIPRAPWGQTMAEARRLQFQRRFDLSEDEASDLVVEVTSAPSDLIDVLPQAVVTTLIEYGSEMTGEAIPFVAKLDAFQDDVLGYLFSKVGVKNGVELLRKAGWHGVWAEIGEEYIGAAAREGVAAGERMVEGEGADTFQEFKGELPGTFKSTLDMYLAFSLIGGVGGAAGTALGKPGQEAVDADTGEPVVMSPVPGAEEAKAGAPTPEELPRGGEGTEGQAPAPTPDELARRRDLEARRSLGPEHRLPAQYAGEGQIPAYRMESVPYRGEEIVTVYRSVPEGVDDFRPGDWVALTREYAEQHGRGRILSKEVPAEDVVWAGTDENEWFWAPAPEQAEAAEAEAGRAEGTGETQPEAEAAPVSEAPQEAPESTQAEEGPDSVRETEAYRARREGGDHTTLVEFVRSQGGVDLRGLPASVMRSEGGDAWTLLNRKAQGRKGYPSGLLKGVGSRAKEPGLSPDRMAMAATEAGFALEEGPNALIEAIESELGGTPTYHPDLLAEAAQEMEAGGSGAGPAIEVDEERVAEFMLSSPATAATGPGAGEEIGGRLRGSLEGVPEWQEGKPISAPQVLKSLSGVVEAAGEARPIKQGRTGGRRTAGVFKPHPNVIRLRTANDVATAAHEAAHAVEHQVFGPKNPWSKLPAPLQADLTALGRALYGSQKPAGGYMREGWAEFVRKYVSEERLPPALSKWFETDFLKAHPEIAKALEGARSAVSQWRLQGSKKRAEASLAKPPSRTREAAKALKEGTAAQAAFDTMVDELGPVFRVTKEAERRLGRALRPSESPAISGKALRRVAPGRLKYMVNYGVTDFAGNRVGPSLREAAKLVQGRKQDFTLYVWAKRSLALWEDPKGSRNPGLSREDAGRLIEELDSPKFAIAADAVYKWQDALLNYAAEASPTYAKAVEEIRARDPGAYAPLRREFQRLDAMHRRSGGGGAARGSLSQRLKGSGRRVMDIFPSILANAERTIVKAHQRFVLDRILDLAKIPDMGHVAEKLPPDRVPVAARTVEELLSEVRKKAGAKDIGEDLEADTLSEVVTFFAPSWNPKQSEDPIIPVLEEGKLVYYSVPGELYRTLEGLDTVYLGKSVEILLGLPARTLRMGATGFNVAFGYITNPSRDVKTLFHNTSSTAKAWDIFGAWFVQMWRAGVRLLTGGKKIDPTTEAFLSLGVEMAQPLSLDSPVVDREAQRLFKTRFQRIIDLRLWPDFLREVIQFTETAPRTAAMRLKGKDIDWIPGTHMDLDQSFTLMVEGKESTTDFTAAGSVGKVANRVIPFFNAQIQGPRITAVRTKQHLGRNILRGLVGSTLPTLYIWWLYGDDDWYKEMPPEEKARHTHIPVGKELVRIARSFEIDYVYGAIPEILVSAADPRRGDGLRNMLGRTFSEGMPEVLDQGYETLAPPVLPVPVKLGLEQMGNYNLHWGTPIVKRGLERMPAEEQYDEFTSRAAVLLGDALNVSPKRIEHMVYGLFGGVGGDVMKLSGTAGDLEKDMEAADIPVAGRLFRRGGQLGRRLKSVDLLYDLRDDYERKQASRKHEETDAERRVRLLLKDATDAVSAMSFVRARTVKVDQQRDITRKMLALARDALQEIEDKAPSLAPFTKARQKWAKEKEALR